MNSMEDSKSYLIVLSLSEGQQCITDRNSQLSTQSHTREKLIKNQFVHHAAIVVTLAAMPGPVFIAEPVCAWASTDCKSK